MPYVAVQADGDMREGSAPLTRMPRARAVELVFDSLDVYTATVEAPRLGEAKLRQALPHMLEERMLGDPADHHFASMPSRAEATTDAAAGRTIIGAIYDAPSTVPGQRLSVAAIDRATLARMLEACAQAQLQPRAAYSELYTLPRPNNGVFGLKISRGRGRGLMRTGLDQACVLDLRDGAAGALGLARAQTEIRQLLVFAVSAGSPTQPLPALDKLGIPRQDAGHPVDVDAIADAVNLLQGSYASAGGYGLTGRLLARLSRDGAWKAPAVWLGVCFAIAVGGLNAYWLKLDSQFEGVRASMQHAFRDAFPNEPVVDELAQARRNVAALRARAGRPSSDDFSVLNAQAAQLLADAPVGVVAAIDYANGSYTLRFAPGSMDNAALRNALQARAMGQNLALRFGVDGSAQLTPAASAGE
jgi:general secretion pathway protein L